MFVLTLVVDLTQKLMWKLNKSIVKEMLPTQAVDFRMEPWWVVCFVNLTTDEYRVKLNFFHFPVCNHVFENGLLTYVFLKLDRAWLVGTKLFLFILR